MFIFCATVSADEQNLTRIEAVKCLASLLNEVGEGEAFDDTNDEVVAYFHKLGIVQGVGRNTFMPYLPVKTQDFMVMLKKTLDRAHPDMFYNNQNVRWYYDQNSISEYAQSYVRFLSAVGVYDSDGFLEPMNAISYQKAQQLIQLAKATFYIFSDAIDTKGYCSSAQLKEMSDSGVFRIYSHAKTHEDLSKKVQFKLQQNFPRLMIKYTI